MALLNQGFKNTDSKEGIQIAEKGESKVYDYEQVLNLIGNGKYNWYLMSTNFTAIMAMGMDVFGLGLVVTAATCDLHLDLNQVSILTAMPFAGKIVMSYPWGYLADTRGRKLVLRWAMVGSFLVSASSSLSPNWQVLAVLRFVSAALSGAADSATYALLGESCSKRVRAKYMLIITSALMITPAINHLIAYFVMKLDFFVNLLGIIYRPWRLLVFILSLPLGLSAIMLHYCMESPKFLANVGRNDEAMDVLTRMFVANGGRINDFPVKQIVLEDNNHVDSKFSLKSLWTQIAPLFQPPLLTKTLLLYFLIFVVYIANNSFALILPVITNMFFTSQTSSSLSRGFCDTFGNSTLAGVKPDQETSRRCDDSINDNTIWTGCAHGVAFCTLNILMSLFARKRKAMTITILVMAAAAAIAVDLTSDPNVGFFFFIVFLTTALVFGVVSSYFVDLYPTSYRGMVACVGMVVARMSAFAGSSVVGSMLTDHCSVTFYAAAGLVLSGALAASLLPPDMHTAI